MCSYASKRRRVALLPRSSEQPRRRSSKQHDCYDYAERDDDGSQNKKLARARPSSRAQNIWFVESLPHPWTIALTHAGGKFASQRDAQHVLALRPYDSKASSIAEIALRPLLLSPSSRTAMPAAQVLICVGCADRPLKSNKSSGLIFSTRHSPEMRVDATAFVPFSYFCIC